MIFTALVTFFSAVSIVQCHIQMMEQNCDTECPAWCRHTTTNSTCRSDQGNIVKCSRNDENGDYHLSFLPCYCLTQYANSSSAVVGLCMHTCTENLPLLNYISLPPRINVTDLSLVVCKNYSRRGQMCGECDTGHGLAVYSYTLNCVNCTHYKMNWLKYLGVAFGPLTLFFVSIVAGRMSVTSGLMVGYVTVSQLIATGIELRFKASELQTRVNILSTVYGIWNLDFFRALYVPFCLHPDVPPLAVITLDYAVALYPLVLVTITYLVLSLCDKCSLKLAPLYRLTHRCYQACDIRDSVIDAFTTALILSYVKILNISFQLLLPVYLRDHDNAVIGKAVYYNGNMEYFGPQHLPYALMALFMSVTFNILPLVMLTLYPCHCFQQCLNRCWKGSGVHNVMDDFYRCYRTSPRDCRLFGVVYLYLRIFNLSLLLVALSPAYLNLVSILYLTMGMLIALVRPHKVHSHNVINAVLFFLIAATKILESALAYSLGVYEHFLLDVYSGIASLLFCLPPFYGLMLLMHRLLPKRLLAKLTLLRRLRTNKREIWNAQESFPHRVSHVDEYTHLINVNK